MRNNTKENLSHTILKRVENLPMFSLENLVSLNNKRTYLKVILSRHSLRGRVVRLKRGFYVSKGYLEKARKDNEFQNYLEFVANAIYGPSYLSLEYVLDEHGMLTESARNITSVSLNKTKNLENEFGAFIYHKIKEELFEGFTTSRKSGFFVLKASKAKALFDYLYFRKNILEDSSAVEELRLNLEGITMKDKKELNRYVKKEGSEKMAKIYQWLWE